MGEEIIRIERPTKKRLDDCIKANRPTIFTGLMEGQPASSWNLAALRAKLAGQSVKVVDHDQPRLYWDPGAGLPIKDMDFGEFADTLGGYDGHYRYLQDDINAFAHLKEDYRLPPMMEQKKIVRAKFWLSGAGLITPLHYDPVETFHWVIRGTKRFLLYPPGVKKYYPYPASSTAPFISRADPDHPDPVHYPLFRDAKPIEFNLDEGEILYLPTYWWHQVYSEGQINVSLNFVWFASRRKNARHRGQYVRTKEHVARQMAKVRELQRRLKEERRHE